MNGTVLVTVPFEQMVKNLFKTMGDTPSSLMHAAIGISGEVSSELMRADSIENIVEECGDVEFYVQAYYQELVAGYGPQPHYVMGSFTAQGIIGFGNVVQELNVVAGILLDNTKKSWVYGKELDASNCAYLLGMLHGYLEQVYRLIGVRREDVLASNQAKLGKRYPDGVYSNKAAQERLDKPAGE